MGHGKDSCQILTHEPATGGFQRIFRRSIWRNRQQWARRFIWPRVARTLISRLGHGHAEPRKAVKTGARRRRNQRGLVHGQKSRACRRLISTWFIVQVARLCEDLARILATTLLSAIEDAHRARKFEIRSRTNSFAPMIAQHLEEFAVALGYRTGKSGLPNRAFPRLSRVPFEHSL